MQNLVIYAIEAPADKYYTHLGQAVWPVNGPNEKQALETMVSSLGGRVEYVMHAEEQYLSGSDFVVGLGEKAVEEARLYAHLTSRTFQFANEVNDLCCLPDVKVVVTSYEFINEQLFDLLYGQCGNIAPGVIFAYEDSDLRQQVLTRAAALRFAGVGFAKRRIDINAMLNAGYHQESEAYSFLGGAVNEEQLLTVLSSGAGLLTLSTHSDGIDAYLKKNFVLCAVKGLGNINNKETAPSCVMTDFCHRCQVPLREAEENGYLLDPKLIKAHVLVYCACWGLYPSQQVHLGQYALSRRILNAQGVGALITSWEINTQDVAVTSSLFHHISQGMPLGEALARHLSSDQAKKIHHKLCLIGDPDIALSKAEAVDPLRAFRVEKEGYVLSSSELYGLTLLRYIGKKFIEYGSEKAEEIVKDIESYEQSVMSGQIYASHEYLLKNKIADFLALQDTMLSKVWSQYALEGEVLASQKRCPICTRRTITRQYALRILGGEPRVEALCPSCGSVQDVSCGHDIELTVDQDGSMHLKYDMPLGYWEARIVVERFHTRDNKIWAWPRDENGLPQSDFKVTEPWPLTPFRVAVVLVYGSYEFAVSGALYRGRGLNSA